MMKAIDLFSGCGGLSLGLGNAGIDVILAIDSWDRAVSLYNKNFSHECKLLDISDVEGVVSVINTLDVDIIVGGPPCQDFSFAGKRKEGDRADLTKSFSEIIVKKKPKWFIMENVDRARNSLAYKSARSRFKDNGYGITEMVLDASKTNVPQKRRRFFVIGGLEYEDGFLEKEILNSLNSKSMTVRQYFGDEISFEHYYRHPRNYNRRGIFSIDEPAPTMRGVNRPLPKGYPGHKGDTTKLSNKVRALTTRERARIQTFPNSFILEGTKTDLEQMIGNAVPVNLAKFIGERLLDFIKFNNVNVNRKVG